MNCTEPLFIRFCLVSHAEDVVGRGVIEPRKGHHKPRRYLALARLIVAVYPLIYPEKSGDLFLNHIVIFTQVSQSRIVQKSHLVPSIATIKK